ncbi:MAG: hypothetical protein LBE75_05990 [Burkholderiales bacterium]|nr:hypothetical protein [Burkholderiales bacterium]
MTNEELLMELENLVIAIEDTFTAITGAICENTSPSRTLKNLLAAETALNVNHGPNEWRDRLFRSPLKIAALKSRAQAVNDPELQSLISSVLSGKTEDDPTH